MLVREAKGAAREWVLERGCRAPGFLGAYVTGSTIWLPEDVPFPATSDLDVKLVLENVGQAPRPGKFLYRGALLEVGLVPRDRLHRPEAVLSSAVLASGFRTESIILDPTGMLASLRDAVSREFARRRWVRIRCQRAADGRRNAEGRLDQAVPLHDQATATVFAAGGVTYLPMVAGLRDPTVRKRYVAAREVLAQFERLDFHEELLALLGCANMTRERVEYHLRGMTAAFDEAKAAVKTTYRFASDISDAARPISIDGTRELIDQGLHRESVFWIAATYGRCRHILAADAPHQLPELDRTYRELLDELGIGSFEDRLRRCAEVEDFLPRAWQVTEDIVAANPEIRD